MLWIWSTYRHKAALTQQPKAPTSARPPTRKYIHLWAPHINVYGEAICVQKNGWILWRGWRSGGGEGDESVEKYFLSPSTIGGHMKKGIYPQKNHSKLHLYIHARIHRASSLLCAHEIRRIEEQISLALWTSSTSRCSTVREFYLSLSLPRNQFSWWTQPKEEKTTHNSLLWLRLKSAKMFPFSTFKPFTTTCSMADFCAYLKSSLVLLLVGSH